MQLLGNGTSRVLYRPLTFLSVYAMLNNITIAAIYTDNQPYNLPQLRGCASYQPRIVKIPSTI